MLIPIHSPSIHETKNSYEFVFESASAKTVSVAGTFNNWNRDASPLVLSQDGRTWRGRFRMDPGTHQYKFVLNGSEWINDPKGKVAPDGFGNDNSFLFVLPYEYDTKPGVEGDGIITTSALQHGFGITAQRLVGSHLWVTCRARKGDLQNVQVKFGKNHTTSEKLFSDEFYDYYRAKLPANKVSKYCVEATDGDSTHTLGTFDLELGLINPSVADWAKGAVGYQIFPERFANGNRSNDPEGVQPWSAKPTYSNYFGGDIAGVRSKIPYLRELGIEAVYFNPVFATSSNHGYETSDYLKIEPRLGSNEEFAKMVDEFHAAGTKVVLDGVFNHSGTKFAPFQDLIQNGEQSPTRDWFFVKNYPVEVRSNPPYEAWYGFASLPKLNVANAQLKRYLFDAVDYWTSFGKIDGWRLDAANEVSDAFWIDFRKKVKAKSRDQWICGEVWTDASQWLRGNMWDSATNYPFRGAVLEFLKSDLGSPSKLSAGLFKNYYSYHPTQAHNLMNILSSHDVPRIATELGNDPEKVKLATTLQFTWPGMPMVYYGDEIGMVGGRDPENRRGMEWEKATSHNPILRHHKTLIEARKASKALRIGEPISLREDDNSGVFAFARQAESDSALIFINRSSKVQKVEVTLPDAPKGKSTRRYRDIFTKRLLFADRWSKISLEVSPMSGAVLVTESKEKSS